MLNESKAAGDSTAHVIELDATAPQLTPTQRKVLEGVHLGLLNKQIAYNLGIAEATVKAHMTALMRKLNVRNRTQVAIVAQAMVDPRALESYRH